MKARRNLTRVINAGHIGAFLTGEIGNHLFQFSLRSRCTAMLAGLRTLIPAARLRYANPAPSPSGTVLNAAREPEVGVARSAASNLPCVRRSAHQLWRLRWRAEQQRRGKVI